MQSNKPNTLDLTNVFETQQSLLIFGGCYSNFEATHALKHLAEQKGISPEQCICTGDIVAYCANPVETTELIQDWGVHCIQGNVEQSLAEKAGDCGCGFEAGTVCDVLSKGWFPFADSVIQQSHREWFQSMPEQLCFSFAGKQIQVVHGAASNVSQFMFESQPDQDYLQEFALVQADIIIAGHSGLPFTKLLGDKVWHNSGALGMPGNDGTQRVWFSILERNKEGDIDFTHHSLEYDCQKTHNTMLNNDLTQGYHEALVSGVWPSMDVLPQTEKGQQGINLKL